MRSQSEGVAAESLKRGFALPLYSYIIGGRIECAFEQHLLSFGLDNLRGMLVVGIPVAGIIRMTASRIGEAEQDGDNLSGTLDAGGNEVANGVAGRLYLVLLVAPCETALQKSCPELQFLLGVSNRLR